MFIIHVFVQAQEHTTFPRIPFSYLSSAAFPPPINFDTGLSTHFLTPLSHPRLSRVLFLLSLNVQKKLLYESRWSQKGKREKKFVPCVNTQCVYRKKNRLEVKINIIRDICACMYVVYI